MPHSPKGKKFTIGDAATYQIKVLGSLDEHWSDRLAGMRITTVCAEDQAPVTTLSGRVMDQAELQGVLSGLYELHLPLLSLELLRVEQRAESEAPQTVEDICPGSHSMPS
jgi:hypothetical protein